jgi:hypothetical protein
VGIDGETMNLNSSKNEIRGLDQVDECDDDEQVSLALEAGRKKAPGE